jgi:hypothetical protein
MGIKYRRISMRDGSQKRLIESHAEHKGAILERLGYTKSRKRN